MQQGFCRPAVAIRQEIQKALVHSQNSPARRAPLRCPADKGRAGQLAGGVVGLAEEDDLHPRDDGVQKLLCHREIIGFVQCKALHRAAHGFECRGVLRKGGGRHQRPAGFYGQRQPEDEVRRAVAAEDLLGGQALRLAQCRAQGAAERVRVAVRLRQGRRDGIGHPFGQAQRADIGRKIQRVAPKLFAVAHPVTAVHQFHKNLLYKSTRRPRPMTSARMLSATIIRLARRMSSGSMDRRASPMVSLG